MFEYYRTKPDGELDGDVHHLSLWNVRRRIALECQRMPLRNVNHFIALANAAPGKPGVDVTHWEDGRMLFSARLVYYP